MNGPHDIGGRHGFGAVDAADVGPFHGDWERRAMAVTLAVNAGGRWSIDRSRFAREDRDPEEYYRIGYFRIWLAALTRLMEDHGMVTRDELAAGHAVQDTPPPARVLTAAEVPAVLKRGGPVDRDPGDSRPALAPGDAVRTLNHQPRGHTRLPAYARDKPARIVGVQGFHVYPDDSAEGRDVAHWLYSVAFDAETLWGRAEAPGDEVILDLWEPYLVRA